MIQEFIRMSLHNYKKYFAAQLKIFAMMALIFCFGLYLIGIQEALWIGLGIAVLDLLPIIGSGMVFIPWAFYEFMMKHQELALKLGLLYLVAFVLKQLIEPLFVGKNLSLPFYIPLGITIVCGVLFNVFGVLVAALIIPIVTTLYEFYLLHSKKQDAYHDSIGK